MRVRIGTTWYEATDGTPLMVFLEPMDRLVINHMDPFSNLYAQFSNADDAKLTMDEKLAWMTTETIKAQPYVPPETMPPEVLSGQNPARFYTDPPSKVTELHPHKADANRLPPEDS